MKINCLKKSKKVSMNKVLDECFDCPSLKGCNEKNGGMILLQVELRKHRQARKAERNRTEAFKGLRHTHEWT